MITILTFSPVFVIKISSSIFSNNLKARLTNQIISVKMPFCSVKLLKDVIVRKFPLKYFLVRKKVYTFAPANKETLLHWCVSSVG